MKVKFFCPRWGSEYLSWHAFFMQVKEAGFDGIEYSIAGNTTKQEMDLVWNYAEKYKLEIIPQHFDTYEADYTKHLNKFAKWFELIKPYPATKINTQTGKDFFSFDQNKTLIELANAQFVHSKTSICHETHRNKFAFAAHVTKAFLTEIAELKLTLDISHWVNVAESFLDDQPEAVELALARTEHLHARVGYPEGPQIPDPRVPEWQEALNKHLNWWDRIAQRKKQENLVLTITTEFGPYPYMVHLPTTNQPIANQWEVNKFMMDLLRSRYSS
jgi:sugar phosphate isomerase/epimerase